MDEQRQEDYLNLINTLLGCTNDEEINRMLDANQNLIDPGLVQMMGQVAEGIAKEGDENTADFLNDVAHQVADALGLLSTNFSFFSYQNSDSQLNFLLRLLQATSDSNVTPQVVYPMLQANTDKLDDSFAQVLLRLVTAALSKAQPGQAHIIAVDISNLSNLIREFPLGNKASNLEISITGCTLAATVFTIQAFPEDWADNQTNLGAAYLGRIRGDKAENIEEAIKCFSAALEVRTRKAFPQQWGITQANLGTAYLYRIRKDSTENLEVAIRLYLDALEVCTYEIYPQRWADIQQNLGLAYRTRISGELAENLEKAISYLSASLKKYTRETFSQDWAMTQQNLGLVYLDRIRGGKAENLEEAIKCFSAALEIYTPEAFPEQWAITKNNLGQTYLDHIRGEREKNLAMAIVYLSSALQVHTKEAFPRHYTVAQFNLGIGYQYTQQIHNACITFAAAIDIAESLRSEIDSGSGIEGDKQKFAEEWNELYQRMVEVCLELGYYDQAIEYLERSKTRNLVELILTRDRHTIFSAEVVAQLDRLRDEIASSQYELQNAIAEDPTALAQHLQQLRQQCNELQERYLPIGSGFQFESFRSTLSERTAIVEFYIATDKLLVFIITKHTQQPIIFSPNLINLKKLANCANSYLKTYSYKKSHWQRRLTTRLHLLAKILHIHEIIEQIPTACDQLILIPLGQPHTFLNNLRINRKRLLDNGFNQNEYKIGSSFKTR